MTTPDPADPSPRALAEHIIMSDSASQRDGEARDVDIEDAATVARALLAALDDAARARALVERSQDMLSRLADRAHLQGDEPAGRAWLALMDEIAPFLAGPPPASAEGGA